MCGCWYEAGGGWVVNGVWRVVGEVVGLLVVCREWQVTGGCDWWWALVGVSLRSWVVVIKWWVVVSM